MRLKFIGLLAVSLLCGAVRAATIPAASCLQTDVAAAVNTATTGDVVTVPAGSCSWSGLSVSKAITLQGAGSTGTGTNITLAGNNTFTKSAAGVMRINGFAFSISNGGNANKGFTIQGGWRTAQPIVFQFNAFTTNGSGLFAVAVPGGLIVANNTFNGQWDDSFLQIKDPQDPQGSWAFPDSLGTHDTNGTLNHYIENNTFTGGTNQGIDCDDACRVVYRFNTLIYSSFNSHGEDTSAVGVRHYEIYNNKFTDPQPAPTCGGSTACLGNINQSIWLRGGTGLIYNNSFDNIAGSFWGTKPEGRENIRGAEDVRPQGTCAQVAYPVPHQLGQNNNGTNTTDPPYGSRGSGDFTDPIYWYGNTGTLTFADAFNWGNPCGFSSFGTFFVEGRDKISTGATKPGYAAYTYPHPLATPQSWKYVQDSLITFCSGNITSCTLQQGNIFPTTAGTIAIIEVGTTNNVNIASVTGGGGTWVICNACHVFQSAPISRALSLAYNLSPAAGTGTFTVTLTGSAGTVFGANFYELLPPVGTTASFDAAGSIADPSCATSCGGVGLTLTGADAVLQILDANSPIDWKAWSAPYTTLPLGDGLNLNATSGTAPTVNVRTPANGAVITAIAFTSTAGTFTAAVPAISVVNFTNVSPNCSPTCTLTIPSTGSGHLLYIEAANINNAFISSIAGGGTWVVPTGANSCRISMVLSGNDALSCAYVLSSSAGATSLSVTMTGSSAESFAIWELASTAGPFAFDAMASATNAASFNPSGVALPLAGANDAIFQSIFVPGGTSSVSLYPQPRIQGQGTQFFNNQAANALLTNTTNGSAPLWVDQQNQATIVTGVAFSASSASSPPPPTANCNEYLTTNPVLGISAAKRACK